MKKHLQQGLSLPAQHSNAIYRGKTFFFLSLFNCFLLMAISQRLAAQASVSNVSFTQYDRYDADGKLLFQNSSLAQVNFSVSPDASTTYYLNIYAKTRSNKDAWIVQNLPVTADPSPAPGSCVSTKVDLKLLEEVPGTRVDKISYATTLSPAITKVAVAVASGASLKERRRVNELNSINALSTTPVATPIAYNAVAVGKGDYLNDVSALYNEAVDLALFSMQTAVTATNKDKNIPPVEEGPNQCLPGAFARSIAWLLGANNYTGVPTPQKIYDTLKKLFDSCSGPNEYTCCINKKKDYLKSLTNGKGTTDHTFWPTNPADSIKKYNDNCDVEVGYENSVGGHIITIVGITCGSDGCCTIRYRDDDRQGQPGGDTCVKTTTICGDSINTPNGKRRIHSVIVECAPAATTNRAAGLQPEHNAELLQNAPNPFGNSTTIGVKVQNAAALQRAVILVSDANGNELKRMPVKLRNGLNQFRYDLPKDVRGVLYYSLEINGKVISTKKMFVQDN